MNDECNHDWASKVCHCDATWEGECRCRYAVVRDGIVQSTYRREADAEKFVEKLNWMLMEVGENPDVSYCALTHRKRPKPLLN